MTEAGRSAWPCGGRTHTLFLESRFHLQLEASASHLHLRAGRVMEVKDEVMEAKYRVMEARDEVVSTIP